LQNIYKMNFPMRILYRLMSGTALLALPYFSTAQVTKATDDYVQTLVNASPITIRVLDNDSVRNGQRLKVDYIPLVNHGKARITADSTAIEFTPDRDFKGIALINYTIGDGGGIYDCGLVVVDIVGNPTPNSQEMNLFTRKGKSVRFTVPEGFVNSSTLQGARVEKVNGHTTVYQFVPNPTLIGTFDLLFNKLENGVTKEFHVQVEVLTAPPVPVYLVDQYRSTPLNSGYRHINVLENILTYPNAQIASVTPIPHGDCWIERVNRGDLRDGNFYVYPRDNFEGTLRIDYEVVYQNGYKEMATVHLTVSNFYPALNKFNITALARQSAQVLNYKVPTDFVSRYTFEISNPTTQNGGSIAFTNGQLLYTSPQNDAITDAFSLRYCVDGDCRTVDVSLNLITASNSCVSDNCVWAGDANRDGKVDISDIFPIGDNIGQYGSKRSNTAENWVPQSSDNWRALSDVPDPKFADTNGDGMINVSDTAAILKHYGNANTIYPERTVEDSQIQTFLLTGVTAIRPGDMIEILVLLGSSDYPAIDTRGLSFSVDYSANKIDEKSLVVDFGRFNWLSRYDAFLTASKIPSKGTVDAGIVRSRDRGASGHGEIGKIRAIVVEDIVGFHEGDKPSVRFKLKSAVLTDGKGHFTAVKGSEIVIPLEVGNKDVAVKDTDVKMFPNPTSDFAEFYLNGYNTIKSIKIFDMRGREVKQLMNVNSKQTRIDMSDVTNGLYMAEVMTEKGRVVKKLQVIK
jgi:Secretion system C-terminal sorting domain/Bacterial Ig domain